jgi:hypothetical protein
MTELYTISNNFFLRSENLKELSVERRTMLKLFLTKLAHDSVQQRAFVNMVIIIIIIIIIYCNWVCNLVMKPYIS